MSSQRVGKVLGRFDFRASRLTQDDLRRFKRRGPHHPVRTSLKAVLLLAGAMLIAPALLPDDSAEQVGSIVIGGKILLIQDKSGSMRQHQQTVDRRVAALRAAGTYSEVACELSDSEFADFADCIGKLKSEKGIDGLYVFGDFVWDWEADGLRRVTEAIGAAGWRLYLETVSRQSDPHADLATLANLSGGAIFRPSQ